MKPPFDSDLKPLTPAGVIFYMLDEATRRKTPSGGAEFGQLPSRFGNTIFYHKDLDQRINEYIERLIEARVNDLTQTKEKTMSKELFDNGTKDKS
jgi:hypothetical protein